VSYSGNASGVQPAQEHAEVQAWFDRHHAEWIRLDSDVRIRVSRSRSANHTELLRLYLECQRDVVGRADGGVVRLQYR
jgi:hypothetical protein